MIYNEENSDLFLNEKWISKFMAYNGITNFPTQFFWGSIYGQFDSNDINKEVCLKGNVNEFFVDYSAFDKYGI